MKLGGSKEKTPKLLLGAPPIADMTPPRQRDARSRRELQRKWIGAVSALALVTIVAVAAGFALKLTAQNNYTDEVKAQKDLLAEIATYDDVNVAIVTTRDLELKKEIALSSEVAWVESVDKVRTALPDGVTLDGYFAVGGGNPADEDATGLSFVAYISSAAPISYSDVLYIFSNIEDLSDIEVGNLTIDDSTGRYTYPVAFSFNSEVMTKRFIEEPETTEAPATEEPASPEGDN